MNSFSFGSKPNYSNQTFGLGSIGDNNTINSTAYKSGNNSTVELSNTTDFLKPVSNYTTGINTGSNTGGEGLGSIFSSDGMKTLGGYAQTGQAVLGLYSGLDNLFGSGAKDRKESKNMMKKAFEQNYAMNDLAINKFKEDNERFKADRERITSSYMV